jgi:hypothetical protein
VLYLNHTTDITGGDIPAVCALLLNCSVFDFLSLFVRYWLQKFAKSSHMIPEKCFTKCGHQKTEIDADFESVEKFEKRVTHIKRRPRTFVHNI